MRRSDRYLSVEGQPKYVQWFVTGDCDSKCKHCNVLGTPLSAPEHLSVSECLLALQNLNVPVSTLEFIGGEPLLFPHLLEVLQAAKERGLRTALATNALSLYPEGKHRQILSLLDSIALSVDGITRDAYSSVRGVDGFGRVLDALEECLNNLGEERVRVVYVLTKPTLSKASELLDFFSSMGVGHLAVNELQLSAYNRASAAQLQLAPQERIAFWEDLLLETRLHPEPEVEAFLPPVFGDYMHKRHGLQVAKAFMGCEAISRTLAMSPDGRLWPCASFYEHPDAYELLMSGNRNSLLAFDARSILAEVEFQDVLRHKNPLSRPDLSPCNSCKYLPALCSPCYFSRGAGDGFSFPFCAFIMARIGSERPGQACGPC